MSVLHATTQRISDRCTPVRSLLLCTLFTVFSPQMARAQTVDWVQSAGGTSPVAEGKRIAVDAYGDSLVIGNFNGTASFGGIELTTAGSSDIFLAKYHSDGTVVWAKSAGSSGYDFAESISVDPSGSSFITGSYAGRASFGALSILSTGGHDMFLVKYDSNGDVLWLRSAGGSSIDRGNAVAVDTAGNCIVTGYTGGMATFGGLTLSDTAGRFIAKYDSDGTILWARSYEGSSGTSCCLGIAVDTQGNIYATGELDLVAKFDAKGNLVWSRGGLGSGQGGHGIAVDTSGNSLVTGTYSGTAAFGPFQLESAGRRDIFLAKYDSSGNVIWARSIGGRSSDQGVDVAVDPAGNIYVTGYFSEAVQFGSSTLVSEGSLDVFVTRIGSDGEIAWASSAGGTGGDWGSGIALGSEGEIFVTGHYRDAASFGGFELVSADSTNIDAFVVKYCEDEDRDVVCNSNDSCPNTPFGLLVDGQGCTITQGPCCFAGGVCIDDSEAKNCAAFPGGMYHGDGLTCDGDPDGDAVPGCGDECPLDSEKTEPGVCGCGISDGDDDGDGVPDCVDRCSSSPIDEPINTCGCTAVGGCCSVTGVCLGPVDREDCVAIGGIYQGSGTTCDGGCGFGDFDGNGSVNLRDASAFQRCFGSPLGSDPGCALFDADACGTVDLGDFEVFHRALAGP